jgi:hypothetical protein
MPQLFVPRLDERRLVAGLPQCGHHAVDAVAGIAIEPADAPVAKSFDDEITNGGHRENPFRARRFEASTDIAPRAGGSRVEIPEVARASCPRTRRASGTR